MSEHTILSAFGFAFYMIASYRFASYRRKCMPFFAYANILLLLASAVLAWPAVVTNSHIFEVNPIIVLTAIPFLASSTFLLYTKQYPYFVVMICSINAVFLVILTREIVLSITQSVSYRDYEFISAYSISLCTSVLYNTAVMIAVVNSKIYFKNNL
jgi:hypothetical protein